MKMKPESLTSTRCFCFQFMCELLPNDGDLMRRSWHSVPCSGVAGCSRMPLDRTTDSCNGVMGNRNFKLWQLLPGSRPSKRVHPGSRCNNIGS